MTITPHIARRMGRPKADKPKVVRVNLYLEEETAERLRGLAALRRRAISATARDILEERLAQLVKQEGVA